MKKEKGITLIELIIVIAVLGILSAVAVSGFFYFKKKTGLDAVVQEIISVLKLAQNKTLSSELNSPFGVYIDTSTNPHRYVLFKGTNYSQRDNSYDLVYYLPNNMEFYNVNLEESQLVFQRLTGLPNNAGEISIKEIGDASQSETIYITNAGIINLAQKTAPNLDENRVKDSRHLHFSYSRNIDTGNENIILTFEGHQTEIIPIGSFLVSGEIMWSGVVKVDGVDQVITITTHRLNNPDTLFSVHRDRRYNNKGLEVWLSGDSTGYLVRYSADGNQISQSSLYVSQYELQ